MKTTDDSSDLSSSVVCTVAEGDFDLGLAALVNSLHASGFRGRLDAAHLKSPISWCPKETDLGGITVAPIPMEGEVAGVQLLKPALILETWQRRKPDRLFYLDADIMLAAPWPVFEDWASCGLALAEDAVGPILPGDPVRHVWSRDILEPLGMQPNPAFRSYVNSGFAGINRDNIQIVEAWKSACGMISKLAEEPAATRTAFHAETIRKATRHADQDALNAILQANGLPALSILGKSGMSFEPGPRMMIHAIGPYKPWRRRHYRELFAGKPGRTMDLRFWELLERGPVHPLPQGVVRRRKRAARLAMLAAPLMPSPNWFR